MLMSFVNWWYWMFEHCKLYNYRTSHCPYQLVSTDLAMQSWNNNYSALVDNQKNILNSENLVLCVSYNFKKKNRHYFPNNLMLNPSLHKY